MAFTALCAASLLVLQTLRVDAFYLPGAAPHDYHEGDEVNLLVNALTPMLAGSGNAKIVRLPTLGAYLAVLTLLGDRNP